MYIYIQVNKKKLYALKLYLVNSFNNVNSFNISESSFHLESQIRENDENYTKRSNTIYRIKVINGTTERSVKLIKDCNSLIIKYKYQRKLFYRNFEITSMNI